MATINFYYRSKKEQSYLTAKLRFSFNKKPFVITAKTKTQTSLEVWQRIDAKRIDDGEIKDQVIDLKKILSKLERHVLKHFEAEPNKFKPTQKQWLQSTLNAFYKPKNEAPSLLIDYLEHFLQVRKNEINKRQRQKFITLKHKLVDLENEHKTEYYIKDVNESFKSSFVDYFNRNNYSINYTKKQFTFVKQICNHAKYNGLEVSPQLDKLTLKSEKIPKIYLTLDELKRIENTNFKSDELKATRDWLLISSYSGQRFSDFIRFNPEMIRIENGKHLIEFTQKKTDKLMTIPLHNKILEIIEANGGNFPKKLIQQKYNNYLKEVCELAEVNKVMKGRKKVNIGTKKEPLYRYKTDFYPKYELISSHVGRRSFATNFYGKIPTTFLIYITGHSTEAMFLNYIGKSNKDLALEVSDYFNTL